jgi:hypothetical protein
MESCGGVALRSGTRVGRWRIVAITSVAIVRGGEDWSGALVVEEREREYTRVRTERSTNGRGGGGGQVVSKNVR